MMMMMMGKIFKIGVPRQAPNRLLELISRTLMTDLETSWTIRTMLSTTRPLGQ